MLINIWIFKLQLTKRYFKNFKTGRTRTEDEGALKVTKVFKVGACAETKLEMKEHRSKVREKASAKCDDKAVTTVCRYVAVAVVNVKLPGRVIFLTDAYQLIYIYGISL